MRLLGESLFRDIEESAEIESKGQELKNALPTSPSCNGHHERDEQDNFETRTLNSPLKAKRFFCRVNLYMCLQLPRFFSSPRKTLCSLPFSKKFSKLVLKPFGVHTTSGRRDLAPFDDARVRGSLFTP